MTGASPACPGVPAIRAILDAARTMGGPTGLALELCILTLALPNEVLAIRLETIDWSKGFVTVPARGGVQRVLALPHAARQAILRFCGVGIGAGQAITAGRGAPLRAAQMRLDRLLDKLADADAATISLPNWNFAGIREDAATALAQQCIDARIIDATLGRQHRRDPSKIRGDPELAAIGAERWVALLEMQSRRPA